MHCTKIRLPTGQVVVICGRRPSKSRGRTLEAQTIETRWGVKPKHPKSEENPTMMTDEQKQLMDVAKKACTRAREEAAKCDKANLPILAREWDYIGRELDQRIDLQERALNQGSLFTAAQAGATGNDQ
jgi:hypothetical protein